MVVGKYLIIKKTILGDYTVVGGLSLISPGTELGVESVSGAFSATIPNQKLEPSWIYIGPTLARKFKPNKYAEQRRDIIYRHNVDDEIKYEVQQEVNIDEDKKELINNKNTNEEEG